MFKVNFYRDSKNVSDVESFLDDLASRSLTNKDARVQYRQVTQYIQFLADYGTRLGEKVTKHLDEDI